MVSNLVTSSVALDTLSLPYLSTSYWSFSSLRPVTTTLASELSTIASARARPELVYQRERDFFRVATGSLTDARRRPDDDHFVVWERHAS